MLNIRMSRTPIEGSPVPGCDTCRAPADTPTVTHITFKLLFYICSFCLRPATSESRLTLRQNATFQRASCPTAGNIASCCFWIYEGPIVADELPHTRRGHGGRALRAGNAIQYGFFVSVQTCFN
jgi:hypothetical protein